MAGHCSVHLERPTRVRWLVLSLACAASWLLYVHRYSWGVVKPAVKTEHPELGDRLGWLDAVFMAAYAIGQVPAGLAGDMRGPRVVLSMLILAWSLALAAVGQLHSYAALAVAMAGFGLAQAGGYPVLTRVTKSWFPLSIRTSVQGVIGTLSGRAGGACASLLVAWLLMGTLGLSWRAALLAIAGLGAALALAFWLVYRDTPRQHPWSNAAEHARVEQGEVPEVLGAKPVLCLSPRNVINLGFLLFYQFAAAFADQLYVFWIPMFLKEAKGLSDKEMGLFAGLPLLGGAVGGAIGGVLNDGLIRVAGRRWGRSLVAFTGKLLAAALITLSVTVADGRLVMLVLLATKFFGDWSLSTLWGTTTDVAGRASGTVFGLINTLGGAGAFLAGPVMGYVQREFGWGTLFFVVAGAYGAASATWLAIDCTRPLVREPDSGMPETPDRVGGSRRR